MQTTQIPFEEQLPPQFTTQQLNDALRSVFDLMEFYMYEWYLTLDTAIGAKQGLLYAPKITGAMHKRHYTKTVKSDIETQLSHLRIPFTIDDDYIRWEYKDVPIEIKILKRRYSFFNHCDTIFYNFDEFRIANPWEKYIKARFIVQ